VQKKNYFPAPGRPDVEEKIISLFQADLTWKKKLFPCFGAGYQEKKFLSLLGGAYERRRPRPRQNSDPFYRR